MLGSSSTVLIAHGHATEETVKNMVLQTENLVRSKMIEKVRQDLMKNE
ncbi:hypothetical protein FACS189456_6780 [Bacteroidia bacterium]|nr:hypothetical protein FACS189456_6780 [Bacteroidia bacterium]